ncbi:unnamed protein product [Spirodela intermedia]|uniref:Uncharacterized protein n=1 Tax=Spirodela intermedia TaxID=51605 RepID=A0A7I8JA27_SPIIN|nr:unnamed protein product [Spirodela intermedia]CAA6666950.1 unnamed protein product [Spirodela intermedia]
MVKKTVIVESNTLNVISLDETIGSLLTYEANVIERRAICKKSKHVKPDCPLHKKKNSNKKQRPMVAPWSDSICSTNDEHEIKKDLCLIARISRLYNLDDSLTCSQLQDDLEKLRDDFEDIRFKPKTL